MSAWSTVVAGTAAARVTVTVPPPTGMAAEPDELVVPLLTVAYRVALPQLAGIPPTVTLATDVPERFWTRGEPLVVQRGVAVELDPRWDVVRDTEAAIPMITPVQRVRARSPPPRHISQPSVGRGGVSR